MKIISRQEIGLRPAKSATKFSERVKGTVAHWEGINTNYTGDLEESKKAFRNIQAAHLANVIEGYVDIAYNFGIDMAGHVLEGRGYNVQSGANGSSTANKQYIAIVFIMGVNQVLTDAARAAYLELANGIGGEKKVHSDFIATACPGDQIRSWIKQGTPTSGSNPTPPPAQPVPVVPSYPLPTDHWYGTPNKNPKNHSGYWQQDRPAIILIQRALGQIADGLYGDKTKAAVINFQNRNGLAADGLAGVKTWTKIFN